MKFCPVKAGILAIALLALPAVPVFADAIGGWMDLSAPGSGPRM